VRKIDIFNSCEVMDQFHNMVHDLLEHPEEINKRVPTINKMAKVFANTFPNADLADVILFASCTIIHAVKTHDEMEAKLNKGRSN
jgi:hypothetical protein